MKSSKNIIRRFSKISLTKQLFLYEAAGGRGKVLTGWMAIVAAIFFSAALFCQPALADTTSTECARLIAERAPLPALCAYSHEQTFTYQSNLNDQSKVKSAIDSFVAGKITADDVETAIKAAGKGRDDIDVVLVYICTNNSGGITRIQVKLNSEAEKSHFTFSAQTGRTGSAEEYTRMRNVIIEKYRPKDNCCTATATSPAAAVTPTPSKSGGVRSQAGSPGMGSMDNSSLTGTVTLEIKTDNGNVHVTLPDDIRAGDTISGTVVDVVQSQVADVKTLEGEVVEVGGKNIPVSSGKLTFTIPTGVSSIPLILKSASGKHIGQAILTINTNFSGNIPTQLGSFAPPRLGQTGRNITIPGNFDGNAANTTINVGGRELPVIAESPRKAVVKIPANTPAGPGNITINENPGNSQTAPFNVVSLELKADKLNLRSGEKTNLHVSITGLEGLKDNSGSIKLQVENVTPQVASLTFSPAFQRNGSVGTLLTRAVDLDGAGTIAFTEQLTGVSPGAFTINATLFDLMRRR